MLRCIFCPLGGALAYLMQCPKLEPGESSINAPWPQNLTPWWSEKGWVEVWGAQGRWPPHGPALEKSGSAGGRNLQAPQRRTPGSHWDHWPHRHVAEQQENQETAAVMIKCVNSAPSLSICWPWPNTALHGRSCELVSGPAIPWRITTPDGEGRL